MSDTARERVLTKLRAAVQQGGFTVANPEPPPAPAYSRAERITRLRSLMETMHTQFHTATSTTWVEALQELLRGRSLNGLLYAPDTAIGAALAAAWSDDLPPLVPYREDIENFKTRLFEIDAAITATAGGIAETGALILWPDSQEPRLMSLVPSIHIAVLEADTIHDTLAAAMTAGDWHNRMPTNVLLISGPSKTADIELTLTFGVHGPKELIVLLLDG